MRFLSRRLVMPNDLNYANSLFGGRALEWIASDYTEKTDSWRYLNYANGF